jgi:hypothetical protein
MTKIQRLKKWIKEGKGCTFEELYMPATKITTKKEATEYFNVLVEYIMQHATKKEYKTPKGAATLLKSNLGYFAGYFSPSTMLRVFKLFNCQHPIFGKVVPTAKEAFAKGLEMGKKAKKSAKTKKD